MGARRDGGRLKEKRERTKNVKVVLTETKKALLRALCRRRRLAHGRRPNRFDSSARACKFCALTILLHSMHFKWYLCYKIQVSIVSLHFNSVNILIKKLIPMEHFLHSSLLNVPAFWSHLHSKQMRKAPSNKAFPKGYKCERLRRMRPTVSHAFPCLHCALHCPTYTDGFFPSCSPTPSERALAETGGGGKIPISQSRESTIA
jgi:hypothetical protein